MCMRRSAGSRSVVTWVLIAGFLLQPVLAYLVTPMIGHDAQGRTVVLCTLKGEKLVTIDIPSAFDQSDDHQDTEHCSALKLFQMASTAQASPEFSAMPIVLYAIASLHQTADLPHRSLHFSAYSTRAPPIVS